MSPLDLARRSMALWMAKRAIEISGTQCVGRVPIWGLAILMFMGMGLVGGEWRVGEAGAQLSIPKAVTTEDEIEVPLEFDLLPFLREPESIYPSEVEDDIWSIRAEPGRRLIAIPVKVEPLDEPYELGTRTIRLSGARFLAWRVARQDEFAVFDTDEEAVVVEENLPDQFVPRVARALEIRPGNDGKGRVAWKMDRFIQNGTVRNDEYDYIYKLDRDALNQLRPGDRPRSQRAVGENRNEIRRENATRLAEWNAKNREFREVSARVRELPDEFEVEMPPRLWAIFEVRGFAKTYEFEGSQPLPWAITEDNIRALQRLGDPTSLGGAGEAVTTDANGIKALSKEYAAVVANVLGMVRASDHPYTHRLAAYAVVNAKLASAAQPGDVLYQLLAALGTGADITAKRLIVTNLLKTIPTRATRQLLAITGRDVLDAGLKTIRLNNLVSGLDKAIGGSKQQQLQEILSEANRVLSDPKGPMMGEALDALLMTSEKDPSALPWLVNGVQFNRVPDNQLDSAIRRVVEEAGTQTLAARWLDQHLLGSQDPRVVKRTLDIIASANRGSAAVTKVFAAFAGLVTKPKAGRESEDRGDDEAVRLTGPLPIDQTSHSIFRALQHGDSQVRALAWQVLPLFVAGTPEQIETLAQSTDDAIAMRAASEVTRIMDLIVDTGLGQRKTPLSLILFLDRQPETLSSLSAAALVRLTLRADAAASERATRALVGSEFDIEPHLIALSYGDREEFAKRVYQNMTRTTPVVVGLLRHRDEAAVVAAWFASRLEAGELPAAKDWVEPLDDEETLLGLVPSSDEDLAVGAVAALVASAGGDERAAIGVARALRRLPDQSPEALSREWAAAKKLVYQQRLKAAEGPYKVTISTYIDISGYVPNQINDLSVYDPISEVSLGIAPLGVDGDAVNLGGSLSLSVPGDRLAIRLDKPAELKNYSHESIAQLPLESVTQPADLLLYPDGSWRVQVQLADRRIVELRLDPIGR